MKDLIARLEAAEEGSRELDGEIQRKIIGFDPDMLPNTWPDIGTPESPWPHYTASLDAKLPWEKEGFWEISGPRQYLHIPSPVPNFWCAEFTFGDRPPYKTVRAWAATEPLVRRAAALKARQA